VTHWPPATASVLIIRVDDVSTRRPLARLSPVSFHHPATPARPRPRPRPTLTSGPTVFDARQRASFIEPVALKRLRENVTPVFAEVNDLALGGGGGSVLVQRGVMQHR